MRSPFTSKSPEIAEGSGRPGLTSGDLVLAVRCDDDDDARGGGNCDTGADARGGANGEGETDAEIDAMPTLAVGGAG